MNRIILFLERELSARLTGLISWGILVIGLMLALSVAWNIKDSSEQLEKKDFDSHCNVLHQVIGNRLADHARVLWSGAALMNASDFVSREDWRIFTQDLRMETQLPGIQGLGFAVLIPREALAQHTQEIRNEGFPEYQVRPAGDRELYSSIIYLEPFSGRNLRAFGYDMFSEPVRRAAMERARDTDAAALSGRVFLVQETDREVQAGTLMYVPVYRKKMPKATVEERRAAIIGWVYSPYRMNDLLQSILRQNNSLFEKSISLVVFDGAQPDLEQVLFTTVPRNERLDQEGGLREKRPVNFNGHHWTLVFRQEKSSLWSHRYVGAWLTLAGGWVCTLLVCLLFRVLLNTQRKAQHLAEQMTFDLQASKRTLRRTAERLSLAVRAGGIGIWDYDVMNNRLDWDEQMFRLYGYAPGQSCEAYAAWQAGLHPDDRQRRDALTQRALQGEQEYDIDFRVLWPDGTLRYIRSLAAVLRDTSGKAVQMIGTNWDITEMKRAEESIRRQATLINSLLDSMPDLIFFKDVKGVYLGCNPNFVAFLGRPKEAIIGKTDYELFAQPVAEAFRENDQRMLELLEPRRNEEWVTYPDGHTVLCDTLKTPYWGPDGELIGILGISRDNTARHQAEESLRESEANFRTFFETMTDMLLVATPDGRILLANAVYSQTLGYTSEELRGMRVLELHPAEVRQEAQEVFAAMFKGERESCPLPLACKDGTLVPVETRIWLGHWNGEKCLFGVSKNLSTEQEAKQRFERLFRNNPCPIALSSLPDQRFIDVNEAFVKTFGFRREEVIGESAVTLNLFAKEEQREALAENILAEGRLVDFEVQMRHKDGVLLDGLFFGEVFRSQGQRYLLSVVTDITARKHAELELARLSVIQRVLMCLATEFVNVPVKEQDAAINQSLETMGLLIQADRAYLFAYDFEAGVMSNTHEWCQEGITLERGNWQNVPVSLFPEWVATHQQGKSVHIPSVAALPQASAVWQILAPQGIQSRITLPLMQDNVCFGFVGFDAVQQEQRWKDEEISVLHVLAELYAHFESRRSMERQTQELQIRLTEARDAAQEAARAKSLFLANMSHEIRTPLNAILGYAQIMGHACVARACPMAKKLGAITRSGEHLLELLNDLLELVRSESQEPRLSVEVFDFYQALEDVRLIFVKHPAAQQLTLEVSAAPEVPRFLCSDAGKIRQVLVNLFGNAIKFTEKGGVRLSVALGPDASTDVRTFVVEVEDTGCGIRPEQVKHLFELFYTQADRLQKAAKGAGLGLPLSRRYARALGGDITLIRSTPGVGSCFSFTFRAHVSEGVAVEQQHKGLVRRLAPKQPPCRILVVDDDGANCEMLVDLLGPLGLKVEVEGSVLKALNRLRQCLDVDLVLMDKRMPEMDGYEAIRHLREIPGGEKLAVLVVSASGEGDEQEKALAAGAKGYVSKPIHREKLLEEIGRVTGIQYEYEPPSSEIKEIPVLNAEALLELPAEFRRMMNQALKRGDIHLLRDLVETLGLEYAGLANGIRVLVDAYDYGRLINLIDSAERITQ